MPYALATTSCSSALNCAMVGLGIGPGDEVVVPAFGWWSNYHSPLVAGALPVFADIDRSMNMDSDDFERKITSATKAITVVHYQGTASNRFGRIIEIAQKNNIAIIEDCAQCCGAEFNGRKLGSFGDICCVSFQQNKVVSAGEGGLMLAKDPKVFERAVRYHDLGMLRNSLACQLDTEPSFKPFAANQYRMSELTGAVALAQMRKLDPEIIQKTKPKFHKLKKAIAERCDGISFRESYDEGDIGIAFYMDMQSPPKAQWFSNALEAEGIRVGPTSGCTNILDSELVQSKLMTHPAMPPFGKGFNGENVTYDPMSCPNTDIICKSMVCVAISPKMTDKYFDEVQRAIIKVWNAKSPEIFK